MWNSLAFIKTSNDPGKSTEDISFNVKFKWFEQLPEDNISSEVINWFTIWALAHQNSSS